MKQKINALIATLKEQREQCMELVHDLVDDYTLSEGETQRALRMLGNIDSDLEYLFDNLQRLGYVDYHNNPTLWDEDAEYRKEKEAISDLLHEMVQPNH